MICVFGIFAAEIASGKDAMQQFGLSACGKATGIVQHAPSSFAGQTAARAVSSSITSRRATAAIEEEYVPPPFEPAEQVGAMAPLGYFDPLGFTKTGDEEGFRKMREAELKHGRVAMMASVGLA